MAYTSWDPISQFERLLDEPYWRIGSPRRSFESTDDRAVRSIRPKMDLHENEEKNLFTAQFEVPGMKKEDISIDVQNGRLTVSGETIVSTDHDERGYAVRERRFGKYSRTLQLPPGVKDTDIRASMDNGVLTVTFPRTTPEQSAKRITIN